MLILSEVCWDRGGRAILDRIDLSVSPGEVVVLLGPSGVGKTSLLRLASGYLSARSGSLSNSFARSAMVFQEPRLLPWANARDNVALVLEAMGVARKTARRRASDWLQHLGFSPDDLAKRPNQLSGGMQARVAIARAFVTAPDFVMMDEPFAALDLGLRRDLQALTRSLIAETGTAMLFVTHDLTEAVRLADRIAILSGSPARLSAIIDHRPVADLADVWNAAAALSRDPKVAPILQGLDGRTP